MKRPAELYACVYVPEFPAQALLRLRRELKERACVVMEGEPPFEEVCSLNTKARLLGIQLGMSRTDVDGFPKVKIFSRSLKTESTVKEMLLECAASYSPRIEDCSNETYFLCAIDIAGTESLFGPPEVLVRRLLQHVHSLGLSARARVSDNFHAAVCLAKASSGRPMDVVRSGEEAAFLSSLPLNNLHTHRRAGRDLFTLGNSYLGHAGSVAREGTDCSHRSRRKTTSATRAWRVAASISACRTSVQARGAAGVGLPSRLAGLADVRYRGNAGSVTSPSESSSRRSRCSHDRSRTGWRRNICTAGSTCTARK